MRPVTSEKSYFVSDFTVDIIRKVGLVSGGHGIPMWVEGRTSAAVSRNLKYFRGQYLFQMCVTPARSRQHLNNLVDSEKKICTVSL